MIEAQDVLIVVDVQNDFCPGGALPVEEGDQVVPVLNRWIREARTAGARIIASRDWHPADHVSFQKQGGPWPAHCIRETEGAEFHADLKLPAETQVVEKGTSTGKDNYSPFDETGLADQLRHEGIQRLWIGGLAQDVCVRATVLDARRAGFETHVITPATRPVEAEAGRRAFEEMQQAGAVLEDHTLEWEQLHD